MVEQVLQSGLPGVLPGVINHLWDGMFKPAWRGAAYPVNRAMPNIGPSPDSAFDCYWRGFFTWAELVTVTLNQGISLRETDNANADWDGYWRKVLESRRPRPSPAMLLWAFDHQVINADQLWDLLDKIGFSHDVSKSWLLGVQTPMSVQDIQTLTSMGVIADSLNHYWLEAGVRTNERQAMYQRLRPWLSTGDALALWRRDSPLMGNQRLSEALKINGVTRPAMLTGLQQLTDQLPSAGDAIRLAAARVWDDNLAVLLGTDQDMPAELRDLLRKIGVEWTMFPARDAANQVRSWTDLHWRGHWQTPTPDTLFTLEQRLAPGQGQRWINRMANPRAWMPADTNAVLQASLVPPNIRDALQATQYQPVGIRAVQRVLRAAIYNPAAVNADPVLARDFPLADTARSKLVSYAEWGARDAGVSPDDAGVLARAAGLLYDEATTRPERRRGETMVNRYCEACICLYRAGGFTRDDALTRMTGAGWDEPAAGLALDAAWLEESCVRLRGVQNRVRSDFYGGVVSADQAVQMLTRAGLQQDVASYLVQNWMLLFTRRRRELQSGAVLKLLKDGIITAPQAIDRLTMLGWLNPDILVMIAEVQSQLAKARVSSAQKLAKAQAAADARHLPLSELNRALKRKLITAGFYENVLAGRGYTLPQIVLKILLAAPHTELSTSQLKAALLDQVLTHDQVEARLKEKGYDDADIAVLFGEWSYHKPAKPVKPGPGPGAAGGTAPPGQGAPASNGQAAPAAP